MKQLHHQLAFRIVVGLIFLSTLTPQLAAATVTWIGDSGDWSEPTHWSTGALPGPDDDVVIDVPGNFTVTHSAEDHGTSTV